MRRNGRQTLLGVSPPNQTVLSQIAFFEGIGRFNLHILQTGIAYFTGVF
jgi:hypothetical protein